MLHVACYLDIRNYVSTLSTGIGSRILRGKSARHVVQHHFCGFFFGRLFGKMQTGRTPVAVSIEQKYSLPIGLVLCSSLFVKIPHDVVAFNLTALQHLVQPADGRHFMPRTSR